MSSLLAMPPELMMQALANLYSDDLLNFCSSCSQIHSCAGPVLENYWDLRERFGSVSIDRQSTYAEQKLSEIADLPIKALYTKSIMIRLTAETSTSIANDQKALCYLQDARSKIQCRAMGDAHREWPQLPDVNSSSNPLDNLILNCLYLFPKMESIHIGTDSISNPLNATEELIRNSVTQNGQAGQTALRSLTEVVISRDSRSNKDEEDQDQDLWLCSAFLGLPGLEKVKAYAIETSGRWIRYCKAKSSTATELVLDDCIVHPEHFRKLFRSFKSLKTFEYSQDFTRRVRSRASEDDLNPAIDEHLLNEEHARKTGTAS